jgi:hypothetical protein
MILRFTDKEVDLLKEALSVYTQTLSERARLLCTGYSAEGIILCCRRFEAEALAADLCHRRPTRTTEIELQTNSSFQLWLGGAG